MIVEFLWGDYGLYSTLLGTQVPPTYVPTCSAVCAIVPIYIV